VRLSPSFILLILRTRMLSPHFIYPVVLVEQHAPFETEARSPQIVR
jgi:hypothetical protein